MAIHRVRGSDGQVHRVEAPLDADPASIVNVVENEIRKQQLISAYTPTEETAAPEHTLGGYGLEALKGIPAGAAGMLETSAIGASALLPEEQEAQARSAISSVAKPIQDYLAPAPGYENSWVRKGSEALGSTIPFLVGGAGLPGLAAGVGLGVSSGAGETIQRAEAKGVKPEDVDSGAVALGSLVGATEFLPPLRIIERGIGKELTHGIESYLGKILHAAGEEGLQEAVANVGQNLIAKGFYDPDQGVFTGTGESAGYGAGVGGLMQALTSLVLGRHAHGVQHDPNGNNKEPPQLDDAGEPMPPPVLGPGGEGRQAEMFDVPTDSVAPTEEQPQGSLLTEDNAPVPEQAESIPQTFKTRGGDEVEAPVAPPEEEPVDTHSEDDAKIIAQYEEIMARKRAEQEARAAEEKAKLPPPALSPTGEGRQAEMFDVPTDHTPGTEENPQGDLFNQELAPGTVQPKPKVEEPPAAVKPKAVPKETQVPSAPAPKAEKAKPAKPKKAAVSEPVTEKVEEPVVEETAPDEAPAESTEEVKAEEPAPAEVAEAEPRTGQEMKRAQKTIKTTEEQDKLRVKEKPEFRGATETPDVAPGSRASKIVADLKNSKEPADKQAKDYYTKFNRIADAHHVLAADIVLTRGQRQKKALQVYKWAEENMPAQALAHLDSEIKKFSGMERKGSVVADRLQKQTSIRKESEKQARDYKKTDEQVLAENEEEKPEPKSVKDVAKAILEYHEEHDDTDHGVDISDEGQDHNLKKRSYHEAATAILHPEIENNLDKGDLKSALEELGNHANQRIGDVARRLATKLGTTKVEVHDILHVHKGGGRSAGRYNTAKNTVYLDRDLGMDAHTLLHEVTHALTAHTIENKSHPVTKQLTRLFNDVRELLDTAYGAESVHEFVAEAMSNPEFQSKLQSIYPDASSRSAWQKFADIVRNFVRRVVGLQSKPVESAFDEADKLINSILSPAPSRVSTESLYGHNPTAFNDMDFYLKDKTSLPTKDDMEVAKAWFKPGINAAKELMLDMMPLNAVAEIMGDKMPVSKDLFKVLEDQAGARQKKLEQIRATHKELLKSVGRDPVKRELFNKIVSESTRNEVDPSEANGAAKYKGDADKLAAWKELRTDWAKLDPEAKAAYTSLRDSYSQLYKDLIATLEGRIDSAIPDAASRKSLKTKLITDILRKGKIEPYFPLYRRGDYWLSYRATDPVNKNEEFYTEAFENEVDRTRAMQALQREGATELTPYKNFKEIALDRVPSSFTYQVIKELQEHNLPKDAIDGVMEVFLSAMPESSYIQSFRKRQGTRGYKMDALSVFEERGSSLAQQIVSMQYDSKLQEINTKVNELAKGSTDDTVHAYAYRLKDYITFAKNPKIAPWGKVLKSVGFGATLGFNVSSVIVNSTNVPVVVFPHLAGRFSGPKATAAIGSAYKTFFSTGTKRTVDTLVPVPDGKGGKTSKVSKTAGWSIDNVDYTDPGLSAEMKELQPLAELMTQRGQISRSLASEALELDNPKLTLMSRINSTMGFVFHHGERLNRQVTAIAAYRLRLEEMKAAGNKLTKENMQEAAEYAVGVLELTNSGALMTTAPRFSQKSTLRNIMFMYKRFGASMYYMQFKMAKEALSSTDKETRRVAKRQIVGLFASSALMAGVQGVPLYGLVSMMGNLVFLDDDDEDFDTLAKKYFGDGAYSGLINAVTGTDVAARIGMTNMIFRSPPNKDQNSHVLQALDMLGGPVFGTISRADDGVKLIQDGEVERGIEKLLPSAISNGMKGLRYGTEGATTLRGDPITEDVSTASSIAQSLGFAPADYTRQLEKNAVNKKIDKSVNTKRTDLLRKYYMAVRHNDHEAARDITQDILELNKKHPSAAITVDSLKRSLKQQAETSQTARRYGGVTINRNMQAEINQLNREYDGEE